MRTRMYGGVRGRKTKIGGKPTFVFLLLDYFINILTRNRPKRVCLMFRLSVIWEIPQGVD